VTAPPTERQKAALHAVVDTALRTADGLLPRLVVLFEPQRSAEAAWVCAWARTRGATPVARSLARAHLPATAERAATAAGSDGDPVLVFADRTLRLPAGVVQLAGTEDTSPLDIWQPDDMTRDQVARLLSRLPSDLRLGTAGRELTCSLGRVVAGTPAGTVQAEPRRANGWFVADGAWAVNRPTCTDARLGRRPVTVRVEDGRVTALDTQDTVLRHLLRRAVDTHRAGTVTAISFGTRPDSGGFCATAGPANATRTGVTLRLAVAEGDAYHPASADLRIDLTAASGEWA
jgi:hypothetical protein